MHRTAPNLSNSTNRVSAHSSRHQTSASFAGFHTAHHSPAAACSLWGSPDESITDYCRFSLFSWVVLAIIWSRTVVKQCYSLYWTLHQPYLCTTKLMVSNTLRRQEIPQINSWLLSSVRIYDEENNKNEEKTLIEKVCIVVYTTIHFIYKLDI